jgi:hypothetical protein
MTKRHGAASVTLLLALVFGGFVLASNPATAADLSRFNPGNIVPDAVFWNKDAMSEQQIRDFIAAKGANCVPGPSGTPCLKDFRMDTRNWDVSPRCTQGYAGASNESAATIIYKIAQSCQINPQVILVTLQKERGLITASGSALTDADYRIAMGYGCPDTAPCESAYYGFQNQVINASAQFRRYSQSPQNYSHKAGQVNHIRFHPNAACGTSAVFIENQATAGLYNYTPYQPNAASLAAGYTTGDGCSSYGNRNFYQFFNDWFGSSVGSAPAIHVDGITAVPNGIYVVGWAWDRDTSAPITVQVEVGSTTTSVTTDLARGDVQRVFGLSHDRVGWQHFAYVPPGSYRVCPSAVDYPTGTLQTAQQCKTVVVPETAVVGAIESSSVTDGNLTVKGWAADPNSPSTAEVVITQGDRVDTIVADLARADIAASRGQHYVNAGYEAVVPVVEGVTQACVSVKDPSNGTSVALGCVPAWTAPGEDPVEPSPPPPTTPPPPASQGLYSPSGVVDRVELMAGGINVAGWAFDPDYVGKINLHVWAGDTRTIIQTGYARPDVARVVPRATGDSGFNETVQAPSATTFTVCVYAMDATRNDNRFLGCTPVTNAAPQFSIDYFNASATSVTVAGWAYDPTTPGTPATVRVRANGETFDLTTGRPRPDVPRVFAGAPSNSGYHETLTFATPLPSGTSNICVEILDTTTGAAARTNCRDVTIP